MKLKWTDTREIAIALSEKHVGVNPIKVRFTDLHRWVCELKNFSDAPDQSNEQILESIQMAWLDEVED